MRQYKSKEQLVLEQNCDMILKSLELQDDFWRHDNGWLIPRKPAAGKGRGGTHRNVHSNQGYANQPWLGRGRGRGCGRGRGYYSADKDAAGNSVRGSGRPPRRKMNSGTRHRYHGGDGQQRPHQGYDPRDARWVQQEERAKNGVGNAQSHWRDNDDFNNFSATNSSNF